MPSPTKDVVTEPTFKLGDLVWSQIAKYPFWPGLIYTALDESYVKSSGDRILYKVYFFDSPTTYDWVGEDRLLPFTGEANFQQQYNDWRKTYSKREKQIDSSLSPEKNRDLLNDIRKANELLPIGVVERLKKFQEHLDSLVGAAEAEEDSKPKVEKVIRYTRTSAPLTNTEFINHMVSQSRSKRKVEHENMETNKRKTLKATKGSSLSLQRVSTIGSNTNGERLFLDTNSSNYVKQRTRSSRLYKPEDQTLDTIMHVPVRERGRCNSDRNHLLTSMTTRSNSQPIAAPGVLTPSSLLPVVYTNVNRTPQTSAPLFVKIAPRPFDSTVSKQVVSNTVSDPIILSPSSSTPEKNVTLSPKMTKSVKSLNYTVVPRSTEQGDIISATTSTFSAPNHKSSTQTSVLTSSQTINPKPLSSPHYSSKASLTAANCGVPKMPVLLTLPTTSATLTSNTGVSSLSSDSTRTTPSTTATLLHMLSSTPRNWAGQDLTTTPTPNILPFVTYETTSTVSYQPLSLGEEFMIIDTIKRESKSSTFDDCKRVGEQTYSKIVQINNDRSIAVSEFWFYMFVFRYVDDFVSYYPNWLQELEQLKRSKKLSTNHEKQIKHLILLMKAYIEQERH